jgi:hypothetical protein
MHQKWTFSVWEDVHLHIGIWIGGVTSIKLFESEWVWIFIQLDTTITFTFSNDTIIHIQIEYATGVWVLNDIVLPGQVK